MGGSGWIFASKAYIHYGPWLLCPDEPLKHLFMASGNLKKALNRPQNSQFSWFWTPYKFWDAFLGRPGWILASKAYIHYEPWLLCPDKRLKHLFMASWSLKQALKGLKMVLVLNPLHLLGKLFWLDHGRSLPLKPVFIMDLKLFSVMKATPESQMSVIPSVRLSVCQSVSL